jgi:hypothetical protein
MGRKVLTISDTFLPTIFGSYKVSSWAVDGEGLPDDTRIINAQVRFIDQGYQDLLLLLESAEWEPQEEGKPYPYVELKFRAVSDRVLESSAI